MANRSNQPPENSDQNTAQYQDSSKEDCRACPFNEDDIHFKYKKHSVLQPESGVFDLIRPCHEFKSLNTAVNMDKKILKAKFAKEVLKFAIGCINVRSNGTIHFGVMDNKEDCRYVHGEIVGIPVKEKDVYVDALDYIEKSVSSNAEDVRTCVRPLRFIEVLDSNSTEKRYVIEVNIVPSIDIVRGKVYDVCLPNTDQKESTKKAEREKNTIFRRVGAKTEPVTDKDLNDFYQRVKDRDAQREQAEKQLSTTPETCQDLGRKLKMLITSGKKCIEKEKWFILVTNGFQPYDLSSIDLLLNMNLFCVFDFDPDSKVSGLCSKYPETCANMHYLDDYEDSSDKIIKMFTTDLHSLKQISWIFCNGRSDLGHLKSGGKTWVREKSSILRDCVSLICKQILPPGTFQVIFLLTSSVEEPLLQTFNVFFTEMKGHENIITLCESQNNFQMWQNYAEGICEKEAVNNSSVVGMKMSHMNATLQQIQPVKACVRKHLPVFVKGTCFLEMHKEEQMYTLEIVTADHCNETTSEFIDENKANIEGQFYHGGRVTWLNFWLAEHDHVKKVIGRDAYHEVSKLLNDAQKYNAEQTSVRIINIYHHPGSGGSTVARQVLWNNRTDLRCAVVKTAEKPDAATVAQHAVELREYDEKDAQSCVPVLLLIEDLDEKYLHDLKRELQEAIHVKEIQYKTLCFILLSCQSSHDPEKKCKESPLQNVAVTSKLSKKERKKFCKKRNMLKKQYKSNKAFIQTFVLMNKEFSVDYVRRFVRNVLQGIDHQTKVTCLIKYVALLNRCVQNSFISWSHCEAFLNITTDVTVFRKQRFQNALGDQAKIVFLHLRDKQTHIDSIRIIHPLVAKEILKQLLGNQQTQSSLANDLLREDVLFEDINERNEHLSFLKALFINHAKISEDEYESSFSPLIEHVRDNESPDKAIELLKEAFNKRFHKDPLFAQQLACLLYTHGKMEDAENWAEKAVNLQPNNSYFLHTKGQVYRKWFQAKCEDIDKITKTKTAENTADAVEMAMKALKCFQDCQKATGTEKGAVNSSGYFSEVDVGFSLLKLISSLQMFANGDSGHAECMKYLLTEYIPAEVKEAWEPFHDRLKELHNKIKNALHWISEDLIFCQTDNADEREMSICSQLKRLSEQCSYYETYFKQPARTALQHEQSTSIPFQSVIDPISGGNITSILSKLINPKEAVPFLENILSFDTSNPRFGERDVVIYSITRIALNCLLPQAERVDDLKSLQDLCKEFLIGTSSRLPSTLFLLTMLFWPEDHDTDEEKITKYQTVQSAVKHLEKKIYMTKTKKTTLCIYFFLATGNGLNKIMCNKMSENLKRAFITKFCCFGSNAQEDVHKLKPVSGWFEDEVVYLEGPQEKMFSILPLDAPSVPAKTKITFYIGFTYRGPVACDIRIRK